MKTKIIVNPISGTQKHKNIDRIFEKYLDHNDQLLTAHHSDDVTETIFLRLLRGTGIDGLQGPHKKRNLGKGYVIRPFLNISKKDIMQYLELNKTIVKLHPKIQYA